MNAFMSEFGKKLADTWLTSLVLPGLLWAAAALTAMVVRGHSALDVKALQLWIELAAGASGGSRAGVVIADVAAALLAASGSGIAANWLGHAIERLWNSPGRRFPGSLLVRWRKDRWSRKLEAVNCALAAGRDQSRKGPATNPAVRSGMSAPSYQRAVADCMRVCPVEPERPTWIADRFLAVDTRIHRIYRLDLSVAWPRLWPLLSDRVRGDFVAARDAYFAGARLVGWAVLYLLVGAWWWPALIVAAGCGIAGWLRSRACAEVLAVLTESAVDLHGVDLAEHFGFDCRGFLTENIGHELTIRLRKDRVFLDLVQERYPTTES